jgi:APA family basic amino acid/polyamine antiporter
MTKVIPPQEGPAVAAPAAGFQQRLGLFDATMLVAGSMIGSGIFVVSAEIARDVGAPGWLLAVWLLTGVITVIGALSYGELAAMMPHAGGQYVYLREAYNPLFGFLYGWTLFLVIQTGTIAAVAVAFAKFLGVWVPWLGTESSTNTVPLFTVPLIRSQITLGHFVAVVVIAFLTLLNCLGVREGKWVQNLFTVLKTVALVLLIIIGLTVAASGVAIAVNSADWWGGATQTVRFVSLQKWLPLPPLALVLMIAGGAMVGSLFSADAWNNVTFTAGEVRNPRRTLPLSLVLGVGMVITLYLLANVSYLTSLPLRGEAGLAEKVRALDLRAAELEEAGQKDAVKTVRDERQALLDRATPFERGIAYARDDRVGTAVLELLSPEFGARLMAAGIMISLFGCANGLILSGARAYYAMARDGLFFPFAGRLNRRGVPAAGLVLQGVWASLLIFSGTYGQLLDYVIFAALLFYVLTVAGLFVLRRTRPDAERPYRAFGYPVVPALYVFLCAVLALDLLVVKPVYTWPGLIIVLTGIPVYFLWRRRAATKAEKVL